MGELGARAAAELELLAPMATAAAAAAAAAAASAASASADDGERIEGFVSGGGGGGEWEGRGLVSGLEVLWECVLDDAAGDARWGACCVGRRGGGGVTVVDVVFFTFTDDHNLVRGCLPYPLFPFSS